MLQLESITRWIKRFWPIIFAVAAGMIFGYIYYAKVGCATGTCPISSNPYISVGYGGILGYLVSIVFDGFRFGSKTGVGSEKAGSGRTQGGGG